MWDNRDNRAPEDSGRREGPFEIWTPGRMAGISSQGRYAYRKQLEAYNNQMREIHLKIQSNDRLFWEEELRLSVFTNAPSKGLTNGLSQ